VDLRLSASRLEALLESAQLLHSSLELEDLLRHLLRSVMVRLLVSRGFVAVEEDGTVKVRLQGACHGCPHAALTIKRGVEARLKEAVPEVHEVVALRD